MKSVVNAFTTLIVEQALRMKRVDNPLIVILLFPKELAMAVGLQRE